MVPLEENKNSREGGKVFPSPYLGNFDREEETSAAVSEFSIFIRRQLAALNVSMLSVLQVFGHHVGLQETGKISTAFAQSSSLPITSSSIDISFSSKI